MRNRRDVPKFDAHTKRGESEIAVYNEGITGFCWMDIKDTTLLSIYHDTWGRKHKTNYERKLKNFERQNYKTNYERPN